MAHILQIQQQVQVTYPEITGRPLDLKVKIITCYQCHLSADRELQFEKFVKVFEMEYEFPGKVLISTLFEYQQKGFANCNNLFSFTVAAVYRFVCRWRLHRLLVTRASLQEILFLKARRTGIM